MPAIALANDDAVLFKSVEHLADRCLATQYRRRQVIQQAGVVGADLLEGGAKVLGRCPRLTGVLD
jgi:hypothetical protein